VKAKTVTVALSAAQAGAFEKAIANHRRLEALIQEMRALSPDPDLTPLPLTLTPLRKALALLTGTGACLSHHRNKPCLNIISKLRPAPDLPPFTPASIRLKQFYLPYSL
jgi:hypothetical protein